MTKRWYQSKTLLFNLAMAILTVLEENSGLIQPYINGNVYAFGLIFLTIGNAILRIITTQGVSLK